MILTISGLHGTGKSTIGKLLSKALGIKYYSTGLAFRDLAKSMNMTLEDSTKYVETHPEIDIKLDEKLKEIAQEGDILIDSQLSGFLLENIADFKIYLICPLEIRVKRIAERDNTTYEYAFKETSTREKSEKERFLKLYKIDLSNLSTIEKTHNILFNTEALSIEQIVDSLLNIVKNRANKNS